MTLAAVVVVQAQQEAMEHLQRREMEEMEQLHPFLVLVLLTLEEAVEVEPETCLIQQAALVVVGMEYLQKVP
jgi:hypothetical protein